jgi:hypothetical protein
MTFRFPSTGRDSIIGNQADGSGTHSFLFAAFYRWILGLLGSLLKNRPALLKWQTNADIDEQSKYCLLTVSEVQVEGASFDGLPA